jgi:hypothetical protein
VGETGFGDANNVEVKSMAVFKGYLNTGNKNASTGTEVWRTADGLTWEQANTDGFGDVNNMNVFALVPFGDHLYAATDNSTMGGGTGGEVWRTADGTTWDQVNTDGFGDANNIVAWTMAVFTDTLYVGTLNLANGAEIWRSTDGTTWEQANTDGFGDANNERAASMTVFDGYLYVGTKNSATGSEIWRTADGTSWTQANSDGFGSAANDRTYALAPFGGYLYAGTRNRSTGGQLWRTADGTTWESVITDGFGDTDNDTINVLAALGDDFYAGTARGSGATTGAELWRSSDGTSWTQVNSDGFGMATNEQINCLAAFGSYYYAGVRNENIGGQVWRTSSISPCTVTSTLDSGAGTLRECLENALSGQTITFDPAVFLPDAPATIALASPLPDITQGDLTIDGTGAGVIIDGNGIAEDVSCLCLHSDGNTVRGLRVGGCAWQGVMVGGAENTVADNVLFGSGGGVALWGTDAYSNTVTGNYIGTDAEGTGGLGNGMLGVVIMDGAHDNIIGGYTPAERNVISNNGGTGVVISQSGTDGNLVVGNYIGTDPAGTAGLGNVLDGVCIVEGAQHNTVEGNVLSDNESHGVYIDGDGSNSNAITGNLIGLAADGATPLGNSNGGVGIYNGAQGNTVGGDTPEERNVISGNDDSGILITGEGTDNNTVSGNYIGTDASGTVALGNGRDGVDILNSAENNTIGGTTDGERNVISGNLHHGIGIYGWPNVGTDNNIVIGNYIGTDVNGTAALGNATNGVRIGDGAKNNVIGGDTPEERNVISGNDEDGVLIGDEGTDDNVVAGNYIGTDVNGTDALANGGHGVEIVEGAKNSTIGGSTDGERNVISGNERYGIRISDEGTDGNVVSGNYIGVDATGLAALGNNGDGVIVTNGANHNRVGGATAGERNVISANGCLGVGLDTNNNVVSGNYIGVDASGMAALGNGCEGVMISEGSQNNTIGGDTPDERNVISGNSFNGVKIDGSDTTGNTVIGNYIGTDVSGTAALPNGANGMDIGAPNNTIGGLTPGARNVVSGNGSNGVMLAGPDSHNNTVVGNCIGTDASGTGALPNTYNGVAIQDGAANNTVGSATDGAGNIIAHNDGNGVMVDGSDSIGNTISRNSITANGGLGIQNQDGGNTELAPPVITEAVGMTVTGTACTDCTLEFFSDDEDEGRVFEGSTTAESDGIFTFSRTESFTGPNVTSTATDAGGNTSEFSAPVSVPVLIIEPDVGAYGTRFDTTGSGWAPIEVVTVEWFWPDGSPVISRDYTADAHGNIDPSDWVAGVGEPAGIYTCTATGPTSGSVTKTFEVLPATEPLLAVWPDSGVVGETFYICGSGFQSSENITLTFTGPATVTLNLTADEEGNLFYIEWNSTGCLWGTYTVGAVGDQGSTASATFEILPIQIYLPLVTKNYQ